ncbi:phosphotransferase family protein [Thermasporomyces composti]|uniref:Phosphotransferase family enzyme n=1 Tax=Thermasporomyces composti TaxID=696763 RepID=A0A3D9V984_THECX|nr:phosphotransferase [Thermasporomyces composti]REF34724.1 phosphotransferase family enzyme [Thermasporomyces composti]
MEGPSSAAGLVHAARALLGADVRPLDGDSGEVFLVGVAGEEAVLRLYARDPARAAVDAALLALVRGLLPVPRVLEQRVRGTPEAPAFLLLERLPGVRLDQWLPEADADLRARAGGSVGRVLAQLAGIPFLRAGEFVGAELRIEARARSASLVDLVEDRRTRGALAALSEEDLTGLVEVARSAEDILDRGGEPRICLVHGDFDPSNLLVDPTTGEVTGVLDWELAHAGTPHTDLGALLRFESDATFAEAVLRAYAWRVPGIATNPDKADDLGALVELARAADLPALLDAAMRSDAAATAAIRLLQATARCRNLAAGRPTWP